MFCYNKHYEDFITLPPLKNLKHEKFAQALITEPSQTAAYAVAYDSKNLQAAGASSSRLLENAKGIRERVLELLERRKAGLDRVSERLRDHLESDTEQISLDTCKTILRVAGAFDTQSDKDSSQNIQINITNLSPSNNV